MPRAAPVAAVSVPSHWLVDYIAHRPDMPIVPGGMRYGLELWNSPGLNFDRRIYAICGWDSGVPEYDACK
jgi:hypothetical protein